MRETKLDQYRPLPEKGAIYTVIYPFARATYTEHDGDEESGYHSTEVPTWKPGVRHADKGEGDVESLADGFGRMVLTVVDVYKPGRYPTRVFYTRTWVNPDGKAFGKAPLKITTVGAFLSYTRGYKHEFVLSGCSCDGCKWPMHDHRKQGWSTGDSEAARAGMNDGLWGGSRQNIAT